VIGLGSSVVIDKPFEETVSAVRVALAEQGFGVLTEIDVRATMKAKLDADLDPYLILGACNPPLAFRALQAEPSLGLLLPCNVIVRRLESGSTIVQAVDPRMMVEAAGNPELGPVADEAAARLGLALATLTSLAA